MAKHCGICQRVYIKGKMVYTAKGGRLQPVRACLKCASNSVAVALPEAAEACACGARATTCVSCAAKAAHKHAAEHAGIQGAITRLQGLVKAHRSGVPASNATKDELTALRLKAAWVEGVESAIELLKTGRF